MRWLVVGYPASEMLTDAALQSRKLFVQLIGELVHVRVLAKSLNFLRGDFTSTPICLHSFCSIWRAVVSSCSASMLT